MSIKEIADNTIRSAQGTEIVHYSDGTIGNIMEVVLTSYSRNKTQLKDFAKYLRGKNIEATCYNTWKFLKDYIQYEKDPKGKQWVRRPERLWRDKKGDCKSYAVFIASVLDNLGIKGAFRFISEYPKIEPSHVYVVVKEGRKEIIIDPVLDRFNVEAEYHKKIDYNMTQVSELAGLRKRNNAISGGLLQNVLLGGKRREVLNASLPGLAILALYQWIPAGPNPTPSMPQLKNLLATSDNLLQYCSPEVIRKRDLSFVSFWDFGAWADVKVENDVFPQMRQHLTKLLGKDPQQWWRDQFRSEGIGIVIPPQLIAAAPKIIAKATDLIKTLVGKVGGLFGGTDITWKRGDPSTWAPSAGDFSTWKLNPLGALNLGISDTGQFFKTDYVAEVTANSGSGTGNSNTTGNSGSDSGSGSNNTSKPPQETQTAGGNTGMILLAAAAIGFLVFRK